VHSAPLNPVVTRVAISSAVLPQAPLSTVVGCPQEGSSTGISNLKGRCSSSHSLSPSQDVLHPSPQLPCQTPSTTIVGGRRLKRLKECAEHHRPFMRLAHMGGKCHHHHHHHHHTALSGAASHCAALAAPREKAMGAQKHTWEATVAALGPNSCHPPSYGRLIHSTRFLQTHDACSTLGCSTSVHGVHMQGLAASGGPGLTRLLP
jgi:hypothetical protein